MNLDRAAGPSSLIGGGGLLPPSCALHEQTRGLGLRSQSEHRDHPFGSSEKRLTLPRASLFPYRQFRARKYTKDSWGPSPTLRGSKRWPRRNGAHASDPTPHGGEPRAIAGRSVELRELKRWPHRSAPLQLGVRDPNCGLRTARDGG